MRHLIKHFALRDIVLIIGVAAIMILIAARISPNSTSITKTRPEYRAQPTANDNKDANGRRGKAAVGRGVVRQDDEYYERRRRYWEDRVEGRLDSEEESGDDNAKDKKDSKAKNDEDKADSKDKEDSEEDAIERRRDYWRDRLDREW